MAFPAHGGPHLAIKHNGRKGKLPDSSAALLSDVRRCHHDHFDGALPISDKDKPPSIVFQVRPRPRESFPSAWIGDGDQRCLNLVWVRFHLRNRTVWYSAVKFPHRAIGGELEA